MCDVYGKAGFALEKMFTNGLNCLKKVEIVFKMKTGQASRGKHTWNGGFS